MASAFHPRLQREKLPAPSNLQALTPARVLVVGLGGIGCPALLALHSYPGLSFVLCDDDLVDPSNLQRQILFTEDDVGKDKGLCARNWLTRNGVAPERIELASGRLVPQSAQQLVSSVDLILEGADNFATKFLAADAGLLAGKPIVHGAAVGWQATAWSVAADGGPCYRCLFEDVPGRDAPNCESAGIMGPVAGFAAAMMAELALCCIAGEPRNGVIFCYDGQRDRFRDVQVPARSDCPLCGQSRRIVDVLHQDYSGRSTKAAERGFTSPAPLT